MRRYSRASMRRLARRMGTDGDSPIVLPQPPPPALPAKADQPPDRPADRPGDHQDHGDHDGPVGGGRVIDVSEVPGTGGQDRPGVSVLPERPERRAVSLLEAERRPLVPASLAHPVLSAKTAARNLGHDVAFHLLRTHVYVLRSVAWTPRGLARLLAGLWAMATDRESAPLRAAAVERNDIGGYLLLSKERRTNLKRRSPMLLASVLAVLASAVAVANPGTRPLALVVLVAVGGWSGRPADRPLMDSPLVASGATRRPTAEMIVRALASAGLCKEDDPPEFLAPGVHVDGPGYAAVVDLPFGYTASQAVSRAEQIAAGLRIDEVRLTVERVRGNNAHAGRIRLWIANEDPWAAKPVASPLVKAPSWDLWKPIPFGVDKRGQLVALTLVWTSMLVGAMPRMGKTFAVRLIAAAAALDPHVRLMVWDGKPGKDYQAFAQVRTATGAASATPWSRAWSPPSAPRSRTWTAASRPSRSCRTRTAPTARSPRRCAPAVTWTFRSR